MQRYDYFFIYTNKNPKKINDCHENFVLGFACAFYYQKKWNNYPIFPILALLLYQREFVYNDKERDAVIDTVVQNFPLNVMYWSDRGDGTFEIIDGQQRTISICQYVNGDFAHFFRYFGNLTAKEKAQILDYELFIYICKSSDKEKLKWFQTINIAGKKLTN